MSRLVGTALVICTSNTASTAGREGGGDGMRFNQSLNGITSYLPMNVKIRRRSSGGAIHRRGRSPGPSHFHTGLPPDLQTRLNKSLNAFKTPSCE
ncbi:hypothetical protein BDZ94DRAFT_1273987 [Collybia nuda]|uniref:Uncharacterized protein n=1 Tax=Collybia nuda TaxID=64659 RepID=A0A9P5XWT4_9AGAR|nr:hypothetical protein BDZ94DRAFT_1273987 [Collybia nuda]